MNQKLYRTMIACLVFFVSEIKAQTVCDSLSVDSISLQSASQFYVYVKNESAYGCAYPSMILTFNSNPYLTAGTSPSYASWLDYAGGANNGMTNFIIPLTQFTPASSVPLNTVFTGTALLEDPNNPNFSCTLLFQFTYGTMASSGIAGNMDGLVQLSLFPNPVQENTTLSITARVKESAEIEVLNVLGETLITLKKELTGSDEVRIDASAGLAPGTYLVRLKTKSIERSLLLIKQ
jgi:hypothetical protein